jgi:hypothetical protein
MAIHGILTPNYALLASYLEPDKLFIATNGYSVAVSLALTAGRRRKANGR